MRLPALLFLSFLVTGCPRTETSSQDAAPPVRPDASLAATTPSASPSAGSTSRDAGAVSSQARAAAVHDLAEGRKLSRAKDWPGAIKAFDRALAVAPDDARVLSEVGWAAFQSNDLARAEIANKRALANAKTPALRAPILYNVGRVAEARGKPDAAKKAYGASLALRDNAEVKKRLEGVGGAASTEDAPRSCATSFADTTALCACLVDHKDEIMTFDEKVTCKASTPALGDPRLGVVGWGTEGLGGRQHLLTVREGNRVRILTELGADYEPGAFGVHNSAKVNGGEKRTVNGHTVVVVRSEQDDNDSNMAGLEFCINHAKLETVCALGDAAGATTCTPPIPVWTETGCGPGLDLDPAELDDETKKELADIKKRATKSHTKTTWNLADTGVVTVTITEGSRDLVPASVLTPHPLWR